MEEHFAGNCSTACDNNPNMNDTLKAVCDTGSQQYCTIGNNIFTKECKSYLTRVTGNAAADRVNQTYSNPIKFSIVDGKPNGTIADYYTNLSNAILAQTSYTDASKIPNLIGSDMKDIVDIIKTNNPNYATDPMYQNLISTALMYCSTTPNVDTNFCAETGNLSWGASEFGNMINATITATKNNKMITGSLVAYYSKQINPSPAQLAKDLADAKLIHSRLPNTVKPIDNMILASLTQDDLLDPNLVLLRTVSPYLQTGIDTFVINLINGPKSSFTRERLGETPNMYSVTLNGTSTLYGTNVRTFLNNLNTYNAANNITTDPLVTLIQMTDNANITACTTGNPLSNPLCSQLAAVSSPATATTIANATVAFCSDQKNVNSSSCITHINGNQKVYNMNDINTKMLNYCISKDGQNDSACNPFSKINGSEQWLINATKNTTDTNGIITSVCGTVGNLSKDTCQSVCAVYPSLCANDLQQKCSIPANRYSSNIDFFQGGSIPEYMSNYQYINMIWIILSIMAVVLAIFCIKRYIIKHSSNTYPDYGVIHHEYDDDTILI